MNISAYKEALARRIEVTLLSREVEQEAHLAGIQAMKRLHNIDIAAEEAADECINYFFSPIGIWGAEGYIVFKKNDDLSGGHVATYEIPLSELFSE